METGRQKKIEWCVWRPVEGRVAIKMPFEVQRGVANRQWLKNALGARIRPEWDKPKQCWWVARNHFGPVVEALTNKLGKIDVFMDFRSVERCDTRCRNARSRECTCSCLGKSHGQGVTYGWKILNDGHTMQQTTGTIRRHFVAVRNEGEEVEG